MKKFFSIWAACLMVLGFTQCKQNAVQPAPQATYSAGQIVGSSSELKIAYVDIDTLLVNYDFYKDLTEQLLRQEENSRLLLNEEAAKFQKDYEDFQKKLQNNVYSSQERAQQENNRLVKKQQELQELQERLSNELMVAQENNSIRVSESIQQFLKEYNKTAGYSIILSKVGDNILWIEQSMNITKEVLAGLNARYNSAN